MGLLHWAFIFLIVAIVAGLLGFRGVAWTAVGIARFLFGVFVVLFLIFVILALTCGNRRPISASKHDRDKPHRCIGLCVPLDCV